MFKCITIIFLVFIGLLSASLIENPVVQIEDGRIRGHVVQPEDGHPYYAFQEIPYATPPVGVLRFLEPKPPQKWTDIRDGTKNTKICTYKSTTYIAPDPRENEDCLYLNVFTPKLVNSLNDTLLPVYVYIYGGMFSFGEPTEYNFQGFLDEDIVVVSLNFRSALGFVSTNDNVIPGNAGLKDQLLALKWVQKNIAKFGGDPTKVTLGGHSSGATSVGYHLHNLKEKGLFRSAILQSFSPLSSFVFTPNPKYFAYLFGKKLDKYFTSTNTSEDLLKLLQSVPVEKLTGFDSHIDFPDWYNLAAYGYRTPFVPVAEDPNYKNAIVTGPMYDDFEAGKSIHVPILIGMTSEEFIDINNLTKVALLVDTDLTQMIDPLVKIKNNNRLGLAQEVKNMYSKNKTFMENKPALVKALTDIYFTMPIMNLAYLQSKFSDVYYYQFSYKSSYNGLQFNEMFDWYDPKELNLAGHCDELAFLYYYRLKAGVRPTVKDIQMRKKLIKLWSNFIKYTNPTPEKDTLFDNVKWPLMKQNDFTYVNLNSTMSINTNPRRFREWQEKLDSYFEHPRYTS